MVCFRWCIPSAGRPLGRACLRSPVAWCLCAGLLAAVAPDPAALDLRFPVSLGCRCLFRRDAGPGALEAAPPPASMACRCYDGLGPGGSDLRLFQFLACRRCQLPSRPLHRPLSPRRPLQPRPPCCPAPHHVQGSRVRRGPPLVVVVFRPTCGFRLPVLIRWLWDCSDSGRGEISARLAGAGSGDTSECHPLPGGVVMASLCAHLRARGETLAPILRIGRRWCHGVIFLLEAVVLHARGVPGAGLVVV